MTSMTISKLLNNIVADKIRIPESQKFFVWSDADICYFFKKYFLTFSIVF